MKGVLRSLFLTTATACAGFASAQYGGGNCPHPPCAPGYAVVRYQQGLSIVEVHCHNSASLDCYSVQTEPGGHVGPDKIQPGDTGKLTVYDSQGKPSDAIEVKFDRSENLGDGSFKHYFFQL